jgi:radical SAM protein with 4Fe4S-binding SPASM domain
MGIEMYFRLNPECYLIRGKKLGAIFDLSDEKLYSLNLQETEIITSCEKNNPIQEYEAVLSELKNLRLGNFYNNRIYIQKLRIGSRIDETDPFYPFSPPDLNRAFLEINNACNRDCWFCGYYGIARSLGCMGCNKWIESGNPLNVERWKKAIDELRDLNCNVIYITGGDLTIEWDKTMDILDYAKNKFSDIYIIIHKQSVSTDKVADVKNKAKLIIQTDELNNLLSDDVSYLLVVTPDNWFNAGSIECKNVMRDYVIKNESSSSDNLPLASKKKISSVNMFKFFDNIEYHPCLGHTLAICYNGDVVPCPMMRNYTFGNLNSMELCDVFGKEWERINEFWRLNLDKIEKCTDCEFRYACTDCRALEEGLTAKLDGKRLCHYNPDQGEWL